MRFAENGCRNKKNGKLSGKSILARLNIGVNMKIKLLVISVMLFATITMIGPSLGSETEHTSKVKSLVQQENIRIQRHIRNSNEPVNFIWIDDKDLAKADANEIITFLKPYKEDDTFLIKERAIKLELRLAALHQQDRILRQKIVDDIVDAQLELNKILNPHPYKWLLGFMAKDFGSETKAKLFDELKKRPNKQIIEICGVADIKEGLPLLKELFIDEIAYATDPNRHTQWYLTIGWSARLACARMGVQKDIKRCIELAELELNGKPPRILHLFHDIGYIRQPEAIDLLMKYVFSDERLSEVSPPVPGEPVASYVIDILAECLRDFPVKKGGRRYKQEKIELCRKWMSEQTEWKIIR